MTALPDTLAELADTIDQVKDRLDSILATLEDWQTPPDPRPAYHPERMGYLSEVRAGDRVLFAGGWREVAYWRQDAYGTVRLTFTDPDMDELVDKGSHAIRIQKRADEQETDALHRGHPSDGPMPEGVTEVDPW